MSPNLNTDARFTLAVIALCGVVMMPLLALSPADATLAATAWLVGVGLSYLAARLVETGADGEGESNAAN
ncbi:hypothetical protein [Halomarina litorea]|uniref:hypothetical protein n=1 Tax=Halomarina litorea TaxID=2961595 RepID=UPI0020C34E83|nr:hypothetical protein [Halomarina sp. BCD28]